MARFLRLFLLSLLFSAGAARETRAQDEPVDGAAEPEPSGGAESEQPGTPSSDTGDPFSGSDSDTASEDDIIMDPELEGVPHASGSEKTTGADEGSGRATGIARMVLRSRFGIDVQWEDERQEVYEATQLMLLEAKVRRSESLRFAAGIRARHQVSAMKEDTAETSAERILLDVAPTAGYADATVADGLHLRAGYQIVRMGRFDVYSASNFLDGLDLRNGPATLPEAAEFAQPALRLDWDAAQWLSLKAIYLPFFQPHIVEYSDSDYALMPMDQATMDAFVSIMVGHQGELPLSDYGREQMKRYLSRSARSRSSEGSFAAFVPDPDLRDPQGALRVTAHGPAGELALTAGTALERLPAVVMTQDHYEMLIDIVERGEADPPDVYAGDPLSVQAFYNRFFVVALDGATHAGPVQFGAEVAYLKDRTLYAARPNSWPLAEYTDLLHAGLRAEYIGGTEWLAALEAFLQYSLYLPFGDDEQWMFLEQNRFLRGAALHLAWSPLDGAVTLEAAGALMSGPTYLVAPRFEVRLVSELYAELGAFFVGGPTPSSTFAGPDMTLGGMYDAVDQVFVGLRWLP